jgi:ABC-type sugar transport system ATPase subunit
MLGDRVVVVIGGKIHQIGSAGEVFLHPVNDAVARFVGADNKLSDLAKAGLFFNRFSRIPG